jgi:hypothetical protein
MSVARASEIPAGYLPRAGALRVEPGERRGEPRLACPPLFVDGLPALVDNVSRSGIALQVSCTVQPGEIYRLHLTDAIDESAATLEAEVVWFDGKRAGLRWCNLSPEQDTWIRLRFKAWVGALVGASRR